MGSEERRRANRVAVNWPARIGRKGMGVSNAQVLDVAIGGVYLECRQELPEKARVLLEIGAEHGGETRKLLAEGEVMRVVAPASGTVWGYGVRFVRLRDEDLFYLLSVVAELWGAGDAVR